MQVDHYVTLHLTATQVEVIPAMQGDGARMLVASLMANGEPWVVPEGTSVGIAYTLPDKTADYYDRLTDGSPAATVAGNLVSVILAPVLTKQAGTAKLSLVLRQGEQQIATFPLQLKVQGAVGKVLGEDVPVQTDGFEGRLYYGGPGGTIIPLAPGDGVEVVQQEDGTFVLVASGGITEETDPTVAEWAKSGQARPYGPENAPPYPVTTVNGKAGAVVLGAEDVGALSKDTKIPGKTSELTNDAGFVDKAVNDLANYYTKVQTQELIAAIPRFRVTVVQQLPAAGEELVLYLVPFATAEGQYLEYIWVDGRWEIIGSQRVDLTGYATEEWVLGKLAALDVDSIQIGGGDGIRLEAEGTATAPVLVLYGAHGDEPVRLAQVAPAQADGEAAPLGQVKQLIKDSGQNETVAMIDYDANVRAVNHRGYSVTAPENTLPAYVLSKKYGFNYAEADVSFTSDGVAVLLHDSTIDRTSNGSGSISALTYDEVSQYDFGSWKNADYTGTRIPTFAEFIRLCKNLCLHPYIELKSNGDYTETQIRGLVDMVKSHGMRGKVTWISFASAFLGYVKEADPGARLGYLVSAVTSDVIATAQTLKNETNEVYIGTSDYSDGAVNLCCDADIPMEVWTINEADVVRALNPYITGVTSDFLHAGRILYDATATPTILDLTVDIGMEGDGINRTGNSAYNATLSNGGAFAYTGKYESNCFVVDGSGALTIPTDFMNGSGQWTIAFAIDTYTLKTTVNFNRVARGSNDVPSIFYSKSNGGFMLKLGSTTMFASKAAWYDEEFLAPYDGNTGGLIFNFPADEKTTFVFRNDGAYISMWVNGSMKIKQAASEYTSRYYASTFSIGDNAAVGYDMRYMECSMLKAWNRALSAEEIGMIS